MRIKPETWFVLIFSLLFVAANTFLTLKYVNLLNAVPVILLVGLWLLFAPEKLFFALILFAPLSITLRRLVPGLEFDFWFPTEPILVALLLLIIIQSVRQQYFQRELLRDSVFWAILLFLLWIVIAVIPSEMVVVSIKSTLVRIWFIGVFFYLAFILFRKDASNIYRFLWAYCIGLAVVVVSTLREQLSRGLFDKHVAHNACAPYFIDHTSYGAAIAFAIPVAVALALKSERRIVRQIAWGLSGLFMVAMVFSYSRAAWISIVIGGGVWALVMLRIKFRYLAVTGIILFALFFTFSDRILFYMERNTTDSSGNLMEHVKSIYNIRTDASNLERLNRWTAALEMYSLRPVFGWGPGAYMFQYAPYQRSYLKTPISTNFGNMGNAHSEYLGLMSESGLPSVILFLTIYILVFYRGFSGIKRIKDHRYRAITVACLVGIVTYFFHGVLNNFLDQDKIAAPFWGFIAIILAIEYNNLASKPQGKELGNGTEAHLVKPQEPSHQ